MKRAFVLVVMTTCFWILVLWGCQTSQQKVEDAQEKVDQLPAPPDVVQWLQEFVQDHYQPEVKRRQRPVSFQPLKDRFGSPASVSTDKKRDGGLA